MHILNKRKLSALQNISDPEYLVCKIQTKHTVPYLYEEDPKCFPCPCRGFCCLHPRPAVWYMLGYTDRPGSLSAGGLSPFFGSCFHAKAVTATLQLHCSRACASSHASLILSLTFRLTPHLHC